MTIALLRNKQLLALIIVALFTALAITYILLSSVVHLNMFHAFTALIIHFS